VPYIRLGKKAQTLPHSGSSHLLDGSRSPTPSVEYQSRFDEWHKKSWVRSGQEHVAVAPFDPERYFFSRDILALFRHPSVARAPDDVQRGLLVLHLYDWLEFTEWLELGPVNDACNMIRRPDFLPWLSPKMKDDAVKIYTDEAGHAQMSHALVEETQKFTGIAPPRLRPQFVDTLDTMVAEYEPEVEPIVKLLFAIVSETLITGSLLKLPKDETVQQAVRDLAQDHATDEGRHHAFFRQVCLFVWPRLPRDLRRRLGPLFPDMILTFLAPDPRALERMLSHYPDVFPSPRLVAESVVGARETLADMRNAAKPTLRMLRQNGVFDEPEVADAFLRRGLTLEGGFGD
jgi:hypothetical protein